MIYIIDGEIVAFVITAGMTLVINSKDAKGASSPVLEVSLVHASTKFLSFNTAVQLAYNFYLGRC